MYTLEELKPRIIEWANERDLIHYENADKQRLKLIEECGELASAILKNDIELQKDSLGDIWVVLIILEAQTGFLDWSFLPNNEKENVYAIKQIIVSPLYYAGEIFNLSANLKHDIQECANLAYNEIKNRKGVTKNGTFIKD